MLLSTESDCEIEKRGKDVFIHVGGKQQAFQHLAHETANRPWPYRFTVEDSRISAKMGTVDIAAAVDAVGLPRVGRVTFGPSVGTVYYGPMTIVGKIDRQWAEQFLAANSSMNDYRLSAVIHQQFILGNARLWEMLSRLAFWPSMRPFSPSKHYRC